MTSSASLPSQIAGYHILPLSLVPLPSFSAEATHYLYVGHHEPKIPTPTTNRCLFLVNVPFDATALHVKHLFSLQLGLPSGRIEEVLFEGQKSKDAQIESHIDTDSHTTMKSKKRKRKSKSVGSIDVESVGLPSTWDRDLLTGSMTAIVQFIDKFSADTALKAVKRIQKEKKSPVWGDGIEGKVPALGSSRYLKHQDLQFPSKSILLESVNSYMTAFAAKEASQAAAQKRKRQETDADGFTTVVRGGRTNPGKQEAAKEQAEKQRGKRKGLEDFYRFQSREKKKERAGDLIKKFQEDQEKIRRMREQRGRFKPER